MYTEYECPYCGELIRIDSDYLEGVTIDDIAESKTFQRECPNCEMLLNITPSMTIDFEVEKCECQGEHHVWKLTNTIPRCMSKMYCIHCGDERELTEDERKEYGIETVAEYLESLKKC